MKLLRTRERFEKAPIKESTQYMTEMREATRLSDDGELDQAWKIVDRWLTENPDDALALTVASHIMDKSKRYTVAYSLAKRVTELRPERVEGWINLGRCLDNMWHLDRAIDSYKTALERCQGPRQKLLVLTNIAAVLIQGGRYEEAEPFCRQALMIEPTDAKSRHNLGLCLLARREWKEGWKYYSASVGTEARRAIQYADEPVWDGTKGKRVVIYGEQGIGDEIVFASMFGEAIAQSKHVVLDCDARLKGLFQRSFPQASVYGTRTELELNWKKEDQQIDASIASGELGQFFRRLDSDFYPEAYLVPCPDRTAMWKGLFASKRKPVIGLAWSGGAWHTGAKHRKLTIDQLRPLFDLDAHFVSLQYRDCSKEIEGTPIVQYPYGTLTKDYDDTAAMVAAMDLVISVPTAVVHLAGALGTACIAMKAPFSCWKFQGQLAWHPSVDLIEHTGWDSTLANALARAKEVLRA